MKKVALPVSVENLIKNINNLKHKTPEAIASLLRTAGINKEELKNWTDFNHPVKDGYGRKLIHKAPQYEIMVMSWCSLDETAIHNHGQTEWGAVQTFGDLRHTVFTYNENYLRTDYKERLSEGEVIPINHQLIHQMSNPADSKCISLHIYGTSKNKLDVTDNSYLFEVGKKKVYNIKGGAFYDLPAAEVNTVEASLFSDRLTEIGHYASLLRFYLKTAVKGPQYLRAVNYFKDRSFESRLTTELEMDSNEVLFFIELKKIKRLLEELDESTSTIDSILHEINTFDRFS